MLCHFSSRERVVPTREAQNTLPEFATSSACMIETVVQVPEEHMGMTAHHQHVTIHGSTEVYSGYWFERTGKQRSSR